MPVGGSNITHNRMGSPKFAVMLLLLSDVASRWKAVKLLFNCRNGRDTLFSVASRLALEPTLRLFSGCEC